MEIINQERKRLFLGHEDLGTIHIHKFALVGKGSYTVLHAHEYDHLMLVNRDVLVYRTNPKEAHYVPAGDKKWIKAHVWHMVIACEDGETECECLFAKYDENGKIFDVKQSSKTPYEEKCDLGYLPSEVRKLIHI